MIKDANIVDLKIKALIVDVMADLNPNDDLKHNMGIMLQKLGEFAEAQRTYIIELDRGDYFEIANEWCAEGISSRSAEVRVVSKVRLGGCLGSFRQKHIAKISSAEQLREPFPQIYETFVRLQISSMIAVPVFVDERLFSILIMENVGSEIYEVQDKTLSYWGRQISLMYERDRLSHRNLSFIEGMRSSNLTEILVYYHSNHYETYRLTQTLRGVIPETGEWQWIRRFYAGIVEPGYRDLVLDKTSDSYLESHLHAGQSNYSIDVERIVNGVSHWFRLDFSVASLDEQGKLDRFLLICKDITEMKREEEEYRQLINALTGFYISSCMVDLKRKTAHPINLSVNMKNVLVGNVAPHQEVLDGFLSQLVEPQYHEVIREFLDIHTMGQRLRDTNILTCEYQGTKIKWGRIILTPAMRSRDGNVEKVVFAVQDIGAEKSREEWMQYKIEHDALTGVLNRAAFNRVIKLLERKEKPFALVVLDIDKFKGINDTYGHDVGDRVLKKLSDCMNECFRASDKIFRLGGDEFAVIMNYITVQDRSHIKKIVSGINERCGESKDGIPVFSVSAGAAFATTGYSEKLYRNADKALYHTKNTTRRGCSIFEELE